MNNSILKYFLFIYIGLMYIFPTAYGLELMPILENQEHKAKELILIKTVADNPNNTDAMYDLAEFYANHRYYKKAISIIERITHLNPMADRAYFLMGKLLGSQKTDPENAINTLEKAIDLQPNEISYREEIVNVYYRLQRYPPALEQIEFILQLAPNDENALYRKSVILHTQGKVKEAENILGLLPNHQHALVLKGIIEQQKGENTFEYFQKIVDRFPENIRARYELGKQLIKQRKLDDAKKLFEAIIDDDPFYQHALFQLVKIYRIQKNNIQANLAKQSLDTINRMGRDQRNEYRSYLRHHPDTATTHFNMGLIFLEIGRGDLAAQEMRETISRDPIHADAHFYLAQIYMSSGEYKNAVSSLQNCLPLMDNKAVIHSLLTQCYLELKDAGRAKKHLQTALQLEPQEPLALRINQLLNRLAE